MLEQMIRNLLRTLNGQRPDQIASMASMAMGGGVTEERCTNLLTQMVEGGEIEMKGQKYFIKR